MADSKPKDLDIGGIGIQAGAVESMPDAEPPATQAFVAEGEGASAWINNKKVNALWCINQNRNSWISIAGIGWKKLANNSDTATVALAILGANAKQTQGAVNYREEADTMIHEIYAW
jgi:hypothetical protein